MLGTTFDDDFFPSVFFTTAPFLCFSFRAVFVVLPCAAFSSVTPPLSDFVLPKVLSFGNLFSTSFPVLPVNVLLVFLFVWLPSPFDLLPSTPFFDIDLALFLYVPVELLAFDDLGLPFLVLSVASFFLFDDVTLFDLVTLPLLNFTSLTSAGCAGC